MREKFCKFTATIRNIALKLLTTLDILILMKIIIGSCFNVILSFRHNLKIIIILHLRTLNKLLAQ